MKVLVVGSGAREHALAWKLAHEGAQVIVAPGNGGTSNAVGVRVEDLDGLADLAQREKIDLTIVGPEAPLAAGIVDVFETRGLTAFGPNRAAARIEASKAWAKEFLSRHHIPTARAHVVASETSARDAIARAGLPVVLKADGLAGGKGVFVVMDNAQMEAALDTLFRSASLGPAASQVLVEEYLEGPELSVLAFTDGERIAVMPAARDYKRLRDYDRGPNTGGMGGYTRPAYATEALMQEVQRRVLEPTVAGMAAEGVPFRGVLYAGLMLTANGPKVLEFNCRFGDPEGQLVLPLLESSLTDVCMQCTGGELRSESVRWSPERTYAVVVASDGYPTRPRTGDVIHGLDEIREDVLVFHAGTASRDGELVSAGGRVLTLVGCDRRAVYAAVDTVQLKAKQFRTDIGVEVGGRIAEAVR
ncbi:MAG: phosphoribosylamine--glycine ligase [Chloroflexi bacterium]|nr:phosphoribosylamine--glycine ligase [Chloroflexota bacterium]